MSKITLEPQTPPQHHHYTLTLQSGTKSPSPHYHPTIGNSPTTTPTIWDTWVYHPHNLGHLGHNHLATGHRKLFQNNGGLKQVRKLNENLLIKYIEYIEYITEIEKKINVEKIDLSMLNKNILKYIYESTKNEELNNLYYIINAGI